MGESRPTMLMGKHGFNVVFVALLLLTGAAFAQQADKAPDAIQEIIVTGSRIPRAGFDTLQPATVLTKEDLDLRGSISLADTLNEQPGFVGLTISPTGGQGIFTTGQNLPNFLGLGPQRTLTLVNGHRFPPGNILYSLAVDLNDIPENLIQRVETIAVGGAPIYGSDAIAGTVNIILKNNFEGLDITGSGGISPEFKDAEKTRVGVTWGKNFGSGRGNITLSGQYTSVNGLKYVDRPATSSPPAFEAPADPNSPYSQVLYNDLTVAVDSLNGLPLFFGNKFGFNIFGNGIPYDITDPNSPLSQIDASGNLLPFVPGAITGSPIFKDGGDGLKLSDFSALNTDLERYNLTLLTSYKFNDSIRVKAEAWFSRSEAKELINQPLFNGPIFGGLPDNNYGNVGSGPIPVLIDNPFLTDATRGAIETALNIVQDFNGDGIADPTIDTNGDGIPDAVGFWRAGALNVLGDHTNRTEHNTYRALIGFDGKVDLAGHNFSWDLTYTNSWVEGEAKRLAINQPHFEQAVQVVTDANGNPACADPSGGCVPLNVVGTPSPGAIDFVSAPVTDKSITKQREFMANLGGDIIDLPAGPVAAELGMSYREEEYHFNPNDLTENGFTRASLIASGGGFDTKEFYGEAVVPLLGGDLNTPWVKSLELEGAIRLIDHSIAGVDTTWTAGLRYRPIDGLELRGNFTKSVRAPSLYETFLPEAKTFSSAADPCDAHLIGQGNVPQTRATNCASDGIVQPFFSYILNASQSGSVSGNKKLDNEVADSRTIGLVFRPRLLKGLTASVDWLDIKLHDAIENLGLTDILTACYDSSNFASEPLCGRFTRDASGQITDFHIGFVNVGLLEITGLQSVVSYGIDLGKYGNVNLSLNHMYLYKHNETTGPGNKQELAGQEGYPKHRLNLNVTWNKGNLTLFNQIRWLDSVVFNNADSQFTRSVSGLGDWFVVNSSLGYTYNKNTQFRLTVDNLLDTGPPSPFLADQAEIKTYFPGVMGRYLILTVREHFD